MRAIGKIQVPDINTKDPVNNGLPKGRYGLDLKIIGPNGELDSEAVIAGGFSYKARFGFVKRGTHEEVVLFEGKGGSGQRYPEQGGPEEGRFAGKEIPNPGYIEENSGFSALADSNGLRMVVNFKHLDDGCYTAFAEIEGVGTVEFPHGDTICVGKAKAR